MYSMEFDPIAHLPRDLSEDDVDFVKVPDLANDESSLYRILATARQIR